LFSQPFRISLLAVAALVALRMGLGFHFLYEGVWKIKHRDEFTAEPFLTQAKGPVAWVFYAMAPDIDGRQRLKVVVDAQGAKSIDPSAFTARWDGIRQDFVRYYGAKDAEARKPFEKSAQQVYDDSVKKLNAYLKRHCDGIAAYFESLDRFENDPARHQAAPFQKKRRWDRMMELRREADRWIKDIETQEKVLKNGLYGLLDESQRARGLVPASWNPLKWDRIEQINFAVTYSLTAMGICLMLGFFTPLAALGGAGFMCFVVLTQPAFPTIYPPDPAVVGHALLVNKDFVEMLALLVVAATAAGRWGGLDFFVARLLSRCDFCPICAKLFPRETSEKRS